MKHLGDITKINGAEVEPVEVIIGGSPCQDLSIAGKRAGLDGECSGLFMEQIRIIKEMRANDRANGRTDDAIRPRYMVWENVPGAFSSNKGEDFRIVLEETAKIADPEISIPRPPQGKWTNAGCIMGRGYSIAWRVLDAQYFGVPQRRRRIALVADFAGGAAPEILFERKSVSGHSEPCEAERKGTAGDAADCTGTASEPIILESNQNHATITDTGVSPTLSASMGMGGGYVPMITGSVKDEQTGTLSTVNNQSVCYPINTMLATRGKALGRGTGFGVGDDGEAQFTLSTAHELAPTITGDHQNRVTDYTALCIGNGQMRNMSMKPIANSLDTMHGRQAVITAVDFFSAKKSDINGTLQARSSNNLNSNNVCRVKNVVRRLTPLECERLQGYPDNYTDIGDWTDTKGKKHKAADSPRYKALGNSIAIPCWRFILQAISDRCKERTMASLFDGIGGFPLIWEQINGSKSCRWVSEIEEFPIAVTKIRFEQE